VTELALMRLNNVAWFAMILRAAVLCKRWWHGALGSLPRNPPPPLIVARDQQVHVSILSCTIRHDTDPDSRRMYTSNKLSRPIFLALFLPGFLPAHVRHALLSHICCNIQPAYQA
jgi:hypothetical protein